MWSCDTCGRPNHRNPLICETCGAAAPGADADQVTLALQRDLAMESHFRGLAFWYRFGAVLLAVSGLAMFGFVRSLQHSALFDPTGGSSSLLAGVLGWAAMFMLAAVVGSFVLGHHLARFANGARLAAAILTIVSLAFALLRFVLTCMAYSRLSSMYGNSGLYDMSPSLAGPIAMFILSTIWSGAIIFTLLSGRAARGVRAGLSHHRGAHGDDEGVDGEDAVLRHSAGGRGLDGAVRDAPDAGDARLLLDVLASREPLVMAALARVGGRLEDAGVGRVGDGGSARRLDGARGLDGAR